ncbi:MAG: alkaline phosphatase [Fibrobacteres bacterium]|nr:alkaline phosphatase [Fibrobacterota bacterium]
MREWLIENGEWGVALLMLLQNLFPLLPSEVIMPLAGFLASIGILDMKGVVLAGLLGSLLGHLPWYFLGFALGEERLEKLVARHGHWIHLRKVHVQKAEAWFDRNNVKAVLLGRLVPGLRTCVNIPAGTTRMHFVPYLVYTLIGDAIWTTLLAYGGYIMGRDYHLIASYMHMFVWVIAGGITALTLVIWIRRHGQHGRPA